MYSNQMRSNMTEHFDTPVLPHSMSMSTPFVPRPSPVHMQKMRGRNDRGSLVNIITSQLSALYSYTCTCIKRGDGVYTTFVM